MSSKKKKKPNTSHIKDGCYLSMREWMEKVSHTNGKEKQASITDKADFKPKLIKKKPEWWGTP